MRRLRKVLFIALASLAGVFLLTVAAWAIDSARHSGRVNRNVDLAGRGVGGMTRAQLATAVESVAGRYDTAKVYVVAPKGSFVTDANELGIKLLDDRTVEATFAVGRSGGPLKELGSWLRGVLAHRRAPVQVSVDENAVYRVVPREDPGPKEAPVEPSFKTEDDGLVAVEGKPGKGIDPAEVIKELPEAARKGTPITVPVHRGTVRPRFSVADAEKLIDKAESVSKSGFTIRAAGQQANVPARTLRSWLQAESRDTGLALGIDDKRAVSDLETLLSKAGTAAVETKFNVVDGVPQIIPGTQGTECCAPAAAEIIEANIDQGRPLSGLTVPLRKVDPKLTVEQARTLAIHVPVGSFTTNYKAGEARNINIQKISDIVRGYVIKPGETFSVNNVVGRRTREKGFVVAGVIQDGVFAEDVGGGVSQFATTMFNAAFFAGLDFGEYQSHSLYISRYPYGREATMGFPHPDLQIKNTTPHGILVWPTYTKTSITVTLYSTKFVEGAQTGQSETPRGPCKRVTTERTRTYVDGTTKVDRVFAIYRPEEGVNCP